MSTQATAPDTAQEQWKESVRHLGMDPDRMKPAFFRRVYFKGLDELTRAHRAPLLGEPLPSPLGHNNLSAVSDEQLIKAVTRHAMGVSPIEDRELRREIDERVERYAFDVYAAEDVDVTKDKPLIINSGPSIVTYKEVRLHPGGYIRIEVPCNFKCQVLKRIGGGGADYDFYIEGKAGASVVVDDKYWEKKNGAPGAQGSPGGPAVATCSTLTPGGSGGEGTHGSDATAGDLGGNGGNGPDVVLTIASLQSSINVLNQGGRGGNGGPGGNGGRGGAGGTGGPHAYCNDRFAPAGSGGKGGNGGKGADGGRGGNGGNGGLLIINAKKAPGVEIIPVVGEAPAGVGGPGGQPGGAGPGGASGGNGGAGGPSGSPGTQTGQKGPDGNYGKKGEIKIE